MPKKSKKKKPEAYTGKSIQVLKGLEAVRERPGMYLGDTASGDALHHLIWEVVDNSVDEHLAGYCDLVEVELYRLERDKDIVRIKDNGRGIPVDWNDQEEMSTLEVIMTILHAGGKFDNESYGQSSGLHGVGVSAVNAVSEWMRVEVCREGKKYCQTYSKGKSTSDVEFMHEVPDDVVGTEMWFEWDSTIFKENTEYQYDRVLKRLQELAFLNPGLTIRFIDSRKSKKKGIDLKYEGGIQEYLEEITKKKESLHDKKINIQDTGLTRSLGLALQWTRSQREDIRAYTNNVRNIDGGTHLTGFRAALTRVVTQWATDKGLLKGLQEGLTGDDIRSGLTAIINLRHPDPSFGSQTKDKLVSSDARKYVEEVMKDQLESWFERYPAEAKKIVEWGVIQARAREAAKKARDTVLRKDIMDPLSLPGKLSDCQSKDPSVSELFIVEGDSAGGSAKQARKREFQAILPLRGKVLNTEDAAAGSVLENKELGTLITALGCGLETAGNFDVKKLRYHRIVILTDADVDGAHIRTLLLTFFYRHMHQLLLDGYVYIGVPPLYRVKTRNYEKFFVTEPEFKKWKSERDRERWETAVDSGKTEEPLEKWLEANPDTSYKLTRYKGLGEMNADTLWHTTLDPDVRTLLQVTQKDAIKAEDLFQTLMSHANVETRREYIEANALAVQNLDI